MNTRSIQFRLIAWYTALAIGAAVVFTDYTWHSLKYYLYDNMQATLGRRAEQIETNILAGQTAATLDTIGPRIEDVYSPEANSRFIRIRRGGAILYVSGKPEDGLFNPETVPAITIKDHAGRRAGLLLVERPTTIGGQAGAIDMGVPVAELDSVLDRLLGILLIALPIAVFVMAAGGYVLIRRALRPVSRISRQAEKITFGNLTNRLPVPATGDALETLSLTLNQMLERLDAAFQQTSRFSADASHELRTPLAIIRGELEELVADAGLNDSLRDRIGSVLEETENLSRITESLFALSRLDAGEAKINPSVFDLRELVATTAEQMLLLAEEKNQTVIMEPSPAVMISAAPVRIKQVVVNLLDNAIKYTPEGGTITLGVRLEGQKAVIDIADNGYGIPADAVPFIFERFFRAPQKASMSDGAGLGLSIVKSICQAHGGSIDVDSAEGRGTRMRVSLPLAIAYNEDLS